ncbi:iron ABC transporter permease [Sulfitobacter sp. F26204]|uniref:lipocalin-like domain-containing protein n=1 Tax=Sulfitobacter sp. F26204 TaxID=2996014 RepID=UPI00225E26E8|nr:lipocalin-like domain-containing protein [Sulfitobacter sp. F26204]MCX7560827.1 iron ABC transporter permease [Sulfitobacter sp. F26204]
MNAKLVLFLLVFPVTLWAQGFSGLGAQVDGFATPAPNPVFDFPEDHGPHPDFRIEWWYVTANLQGADGQDYGLQWTLFRTALAPGEAAGWRSPQVWFAHAAVTTPKAHFASERFARGGIGQAGVEAAPFHAWIDEWALSGADFDRLDLKARGADFGFDMTLDALGPLVFHGADGYSVKSREGQASYYYSQPFFDIEGKLILPEGTVPVSGKAWLDREWSSQPLSENQTGWDWFSLSFDDGAKLMGFLLRQNDGTTFSASTWITSEGEAVTLPADAFRAVALEKHRIAGREIPTSWQVTLPERGINVTVAALNPNSWMDLSIPYWEGPVRISGSHAGKGYLEMTGYE